MDAKEKPTVGPCPQVSIQIDHAITALEAVAQMPPGPFQSSLTKTLEQYLGSLQYEYEANCRGMDRLHQN
ncbi:MAG: hypothetical protein ABSD75_25540 [Terriglobales bacterium]